MLNYSLCEQVSPTRVWTLLSGLLLFTVSRPLIVAIVIVAFVSLPWVLKRSRWKMPMIRLSIAALVIYLVIISPVFSRLGTQLLVKFVPADSGKQADAVVVLGRGRDKTQCGRK
jgi:hypothetical protein